MKNILDLHTHSILSNHAYSSVTENIDEALKKGMKYLGVLEHQYDSCGVGAHYFAVANLGEVPDYVEGLRIIKGVELNILDKGEFDLSKTNLNKLDYAIASMHQFIYSKDHTKEENTQAYINVCQNEKVKILGHIDRLGFPCDYKRVIKAAKETGTIIEMNNSSLKDQNPQVIANDIEILRLCKEYQCPVIIDSDAHIRYSIGNFADSFKIIQEVDFPLELVLNFNEELFKEYFNYCL